jgi:CheY-like chemotaxis protein
MNNGTKTLLLVEDEAIIAMSEVILLQNEGFAVIQASNGEDAIELIRSGRIGIDLVLMDIDLGRGMDGTEAARAIVQARDIPVVFLSSHSEREVVDHARGITNYGYILKNAGETVFLAGIDMAFKLHHAVSGQACAWEGGQP